MLGMCDVRDVGCSGCGMLGMWDVRDVRCSGCGMFGMWDVGDVGCSGCRILGMWDVRDGECSGCAVLIYKMPSNLCIEIIFCPICDVINFEIILSFLSNRFSTKPNSQYKNVNISRTKRDLI